MITDLGLPYTNLGSRRLSLPALFTAVPDGYSGPSAYMQPVKTGAISSFGQATATMNSTTALTSGIALTGQLSAIFGGAGPLKLLVGISGPAVVSMSASGNMTAKAILSGAITCVVTETGDSSMIVSLSGSTMPTEYQQIADAVWKWILENGLSAEEIMRILLAVSAGDRTVVDLGGGVKQVTFYSDDTLTARVDGKLNTTTGDRYDITTNGA